MSINGIDLLTFADELEKAQRHSTFVSKVRQATAVASAHQDLRSANDALDTLVDLNTSRLAMPATPDGVERASSEDGVVAGALLAHATILYARATETKPIDRCKWFGRSLCSPEQQLWHEEVMRFRDKSLAHFGIGSDLQDGPTIRHALVLRTPSKEARPSISFVEIRANTRGRFTERLHSLVEHLLPIAVERFNKRINEVWAIFRSDIMPDEGIGDIVRKCFFHSDTLGLGAVPMFSDTESQELSAHFVIRKQFPSTS